MTYAELKSNIAAWFKRTDATSVIATFVALAEADIRNDVRVQAMEQRTTGTMTGETLDHPARLLAARQLLIGEDNYGYVTPEEYERMSGGNVFTSIGSKFYVKGASAGTAYTLVYFQADAALSADGDTNWVLTNAPDVYLWAALRHASLWALDDAAVAKFAQLYAGSVDRLNRREQQARYAGPLEMRAINGVVP